MPGKQELVERISFETGLPKAHAARALEVMVDALLEWLQTGERVAIPGLGIFYTSQRGTRRARNPQTGEPLELPPTRIARFRPAKELKEAVNRRS